MSHVNIPQLFLKPQFRERFLLLFLNIKSWPVSKPLTWRGPEGVAMVFGPAWWVKAWVEVKEPEGCGCVWEALRANQTQLQPSSDVLLHLGGPGRPQVNIVLELHVTTCTQKLHWVSSTLGLWGMVRGGVVKADSARSYTNTNEYTPRQREEFELRVGATFLLN